jgi:hypothetical protein
MNFMRPVARPNLPNSPTHRCVANPLSPKAFPPLPKIGKCSFCPPQAAGKGYAFAEELNPNSPQEKNMNKTILRIV